MRNMKLLVVPLLLVLIAGCGGGGGGSNGGGNAISGHVPYLISAPSVSYKLSTIVTPSYYDVTVTLQANGPTGVYNVSLIMYDVTNSSNFDFPTMINISGTTWRGSTLPLVPLPSGQYQIDSITLNDADILSATHWRSGWYIIEPMISNDFYFVDEREITTVPSMSFLFYNYGLSGFPVTRFTLP